MTHPTLAASIAVFRDDGRVLVATRTKSPGDGLWSLPGGRVEPGETLRQAALRELGEEVGIEAEIVGFVDHAEVIRRDDHGRITRHFVVASFAGAWLAGEARPGPEAGEVRWILPADAASLRATTGLADILEKAAALVAARRSPR